MNKQMNSIIEYWIVPCNVKRFDIIAHFKKHNTVVWRNAFSMKKNDVAYIYLAGPFSEIRYKCHVLTDIVDEEILSENKYAISEKPSKNYYSKKDKYMILQLDQVFPEEFLTLKTLKENGLGQVQIQARADRKLRKYLQSISTDDRRILS